MAPQKGEGAPHAPVGLKEEIRQNLPFRTNGHEAYLALLRTADQARRRVAVVLEAADVTLQQYNVLRILRGAGEKGLPTLEIAARMIERVPGITRLIDRLEDKGLVVRERFKHDRRTVWCRVTPAGLEVLAGLDAPVERVDGDTFMKMEPEELDRLVEILAKLRSCLAE